jgi:hypothetical protein
VSHHSHIETWIEGPSPRMRTSQAIHCRFRTQTECDAAYQAWKNEVAEEKAEAKVESNEAKRVRRDAAFTSFMEKETRRVGEILRDSKEPDPAAGLSTINFRRLPPPQSAARG